MTLQLLFFSQDRHTCFKIRGGNVGDEAAFKPGAKTFLQSFNILRRPVTGNDNLLVRVVKRIEGVEEFFLGTFFSNQKLYVVNEKNINIAVFFPELGHAVAVSGPQSLDKLIGKVFGGNVQNLGIGIFL